jgi:hypothetical protein
MSERREGGIRWKAEPESTHESETQAEPTGWEAEPESTHESERGPSGPARGDAGRSDPRGAEPGVDPSTRARSGQR